MRILRLDPADALGSLVLSEGRLRDQGDAAMMAGQLRLFDMPTVVFGPPAFDPLAPCADCGTATLPRDRPSEWYAVANDIWNRAVPEDTHTLQTFLCIGCLEGRLGRRLERADFPDLPVNREDLEYVTARLRSRLTGRADLLDHHPQPTGGATTP